MNPCAAFGILLVVSAGFSCGNARKARFNDMLNISGKPRKLGSPKKIPSASLTSLTNNTFIYLSVS